MYLPIDFSVHLRLKIGDFLEEDRKEVVNNVEQLFKKHTSYFDFYEFSQTLYVNTKLLAFKATDATKLARNLYHYFADSLGLDESEYEITLKCGDIFKEKAEDVPF